MTFKVLESDESQIYLNLTTLEGKKVTVKLCARGFCVVSKEAHDTDSTGKSWNTFKVGLLFSSWFKELKSKIPPPDPDV